ncbi:MAG: site-specific integrase [Chitinophagaceae bacterium]|nr:site-specific integrase [Chitinophagaceae bacterium]
MRSNNSFGLIFYPRMARLSGDTAPLMARITVDGIRKDISLKHRIPVNRWNNTKEMVSGGDLEAKSLNKYIEEVRTELNNCYRLLQIDKKMITAEAVKSKFLGTDETQKSLLEVIKYHNDTMLETLAWGTAKNYYTTEKYVIAFLKVKLKTSDVFLSQLNYKFLTDFEMFLRTHVPEVNQKPCGNNTVMKHIERFRKITSMAMSNDWIKQDPFLKFKPHFIKKDRGFLNEQELAIIENKQIDIARIEVVRDLFIFSCYTGLTYMDAYNLKTENIHLGINGKKWIIIQRQKTGVQANIPLLPKALEILEKYKDHPRSKSKGTLLPLISNQPFNFFLKEIAVICGINKNLTHHLARHTFATTVCLLNGISMEATSGMMGHTNMRTTQIYGKILPQRISSEMEALEAKLQSKVQTPETKTGSN